MQFNLKNRPVPFVTMKKNIGWVKQYSDWFEGFEKQIREKREFLKHHQLETNPLESNDWNIGYNHGLNKAIDDLTEILGEEVG